jgi:hypothetical protein
MFIVRKSGHGLFGGGGTSYLIQASKKHDSKYRWEKTSRIKASAFSAKRAAQLWASRLGGEVVELVG